MTQSEKNEAMLEYLLSCEDLSDNELFFNYADEESNSNHIQTVADEVAMQKPYIDGSVLKAYTFVLTSYKTISANPIQDIAQFSDENMENIAEVQKILDWIELQNDLRNYPDFGEKAVPDKIYCMTNIPNLYAVNTESDPPLAKYSIVIRFEYVDNTKRIY